MDHNKKHSQIKKVYLNFYSFQWIQRLLRSHQHEETFTFYRLSVGLITKLHVCNISLRLVWSICVQWNFLNINKLPVLVIFFSSVTVLKSKYSQEKIIIQSVKRTENWHKRTIKRIKNYSLFLRLQFVSPPQILVYVRNIIAMQAELSFTFNQSIDLTQDFLNQKSKLTSNSG